MDGKLKKLPVIFMLVAGAVTGIFTYVLQYEGKTALLILLAVLLLFYGIGYFFYRMLLRFEEDISEKQRMRLEEGKVLEKSAEGTEGKEDKEAEDGVKDAGEQ